MRRVPAPLLPRLKTIWTTHGARPFLGLLRSGGFDLFHSHLSVYSPGAAAAAYLAHRAGIPTVVTFHSVVTGYLPAFSLLDRLTGWSGLPIAFTAVSDLVARQLVPLLAPRTVDILPPAVDPALWRNGPRARAGNTFRIVSTMRLARRKRPRALIDVLAAVRADLPPSIRMRARIIGDGPWRGRLERLIEKRGLGAEIRLTGAMTGEELRREYADADVFVLASIEESFGLAALEARAAGLPVVALSESGPAQFVRHELEGLLARSDSDLAASLVRLATDRALLEGIAHHNRTYPPAFSPAESVRRHEDVYSAALARRG